MKKSVIFNIFSQRDENNKPFNPLNSLLEEKMDALTSLDIVELTEKLEKEFSNIEKVRQKLVKDIFGIDEKTGEVKNLDNQEKIKEFNSELNKILEQEIEIEKIKVKASGLKISPKNILLLKNIINFTK